MINIVDYPPKTDNEAFDSWIQRLVDELRNPDVLEVNHIIVNSSATFVNIDYSKVGGTITIDAPNNRISVDTIVLDGAENEIRIGGTNVKLDGDAQALYLKNTTFGQAGIQLEYNSGTTRGYLGNGANEYIKFDGTNLSWKGANSELDTSGNITLAGGTIGGWNITSDKISITGIELDQANNRIRVFTGANYVDMTSGGLVGVDSVLGTTFSLLTDGSAPEFSSGIIKECEYQVYTSGVIKTSDDPTTDGGFLINNTRIAGYDDTPLKTFEIIYSGSDKGDGYLGDYDSGNAGWKYDHSAKVLDFRGIISIDSFNQLPSDENLVGYWSFDDGVGIVATDNSGRGHPGTLINGPTWVQGISGKALDFESGSSQYVNIPHHADFSFDKDDAFSFSLSYKPESLTTTRMLITKMGGSPYTGYQFYVDNAGAIVYLLVSNYTTSNCLYVKTANGIISAGTKYDIVFAYDGSEAAAGITILVDGASIGLNTLVDNLTGPITNAIDLRIGIRGDNTSPADGIIDNVRCYSIELTESNAKALHLNPSGNESVIKGGFGNIAGYHSRLTSSGLAIYNGATLRALYGTSITLYDSGGADRLVLSTSGVVVGDQTEGEFVNIDATNGIRMYGGGVLNAQLTNAGILTLGYVGGGEYVQVDSTGVEVYGNAVKNFEVTSAGLVYAGDQANEHIKLSSSGLQVYDGATERALFGATMRVGLQAAGKGNFYIDADGNSCWRVNETAYLTIGTDGVSSFNMIAGSDITLTGHDDNPAEIIWHGSSYDIKMGVDTVGTAFRFFPDTNDTGQILFGVSDKLWSNMQFTSHDYTQMIAWLDENNNSYIKCQTSGELAIIYVENGGVSQTYFFSELMIYPGIDKGPDIGGAAIAFDDGYADDWNNVADFYLMDDRDDLALLHQIKGSGIIDERTGFELIDDNTLDESLLVKYKQDIYDEDGNLIANKGDIARDSERKPYISTKTWDSLLAGAIRKLDNKYKQHLIDYH